MKCGWLLLWLGCLLGSGGISATAFAASEKQAFDSASEAFRIEVWDRAEFEFGEFIKDFPQSEKLSQALLLQAEAMYHQKKFSEAAALLQAQFETAGSAQGSFLYWIGNAQLEAKQYPQAAASFGRLARDFPLSTQRLEAAVNEAVAYAQQTNWVEVVTLLKQPDGPFRQAEVSARGSELAARGFLLLAQAQFELKLYPDAEVTLHKIAGSLQGELEWQRLDWLCRTLMARNNLEAAATESAQLVAVAEGLPQRERLARSVARRADLLERLQRNDEAISTWARNLTNTPAAWERQALSQIVGLELRQNKIGAAAQRLEAYLAQTTNAPAADVAWLTLGELYLKQQVGRLPSGETNEVQIDRLSLATNCFQKVLQEFPQSSYAGRARLNLGWVYWVQSNYTASATAFAAAAEQLPVSEDLAVAKLKWADALYQLKDFAGARTNYESVLELLPQWPALDAALRPLASYQALRAGLATPGATVALSTAEAAMRGILEANPASELAANSVLLVAQAYLDAHDTTEAQRICEEFVRRYPQSELRPEVELMIAKMREAIGDWAAVLQDYQKWLEQFPTNRLRPQVEFQMALATARSGAETNALTLFTNFVAQFPGNALAPRAQWWIADFYFGRGAYSEAEIQYKQLFQNWKNSSLTYEAHLMAGRAALPRSLPDALEHFSNIMSDTNCPVALRVQALFAYGGVAMKMVPSVTNKFERLEQARQAFQAVITEYPTNELVAQAWGEVGNCSLQLAAAEPANYLTASNAYQQALTIPSANVATRSQALNGLATVLEKQAALQTDGTLTTNLLRQARNYDLDVYWDKQLAAGETADPYWKKRAGMEAARLSESLGDWPVALGLYRDMARLNLWPSDQLEKKIANLSQLVAETTKAN